MKTMKKYFSIIEKYIWLIFPDVLCLYKREMKRLKLTILAPKLPAPNQVTLDVESHPDEIKYVISKDKTESNVD